MVVVKKRSKAWDHFVDIIDGNEKTVQVGFFVGVMWEELGRALNGEANRREDFLCDDKIELSRDLVARWRR